jgi:hypothetical protein
MRDPKRARPSTARFRVSNEQCDYKCLRSKPNTPVAAIQAEVVSAIVPSLYLGEGVALFTFLRGELTLGDLDKMSVRIGMAAIYRWLTTPLDDQEVGGG